MPTPRHQRPTQLDTFLFGAPYYPEHWSSADRADDAERMQTAGVNVVRMAEFAWDRIEPEPGAYDFSLFDEVIAHLGEHGIKTILCTPTATPPRWLTHGRDDLMRTDADCNRMVHGSRQHCCTNNADFREASRTITAVMAAHYADNSNVIGWQTDNEFFCHFAYCYCPACVQSFRDWLEAKYGDIAELNRRWGTAFWAQTYQTFDQIELPKLKRPTHPNPSQYLDFMRFLNFGITCFQQEQIDLLREANAGWWITHNGLFGPIDHWTFAENLDFYGVDVYPSFAYSEPADYLWAALKAENCRAASGNFIVPEQQSGPGSQGPYLHPTLPPGQMRLWVFQMVAHGCDALLHFRWRTCRFGAEMYWNGVIDQDNILRRRYEEFSQEGRELKSLTPYLQGTAEKVDAAVLVEKEQEMAHETMPLDLPSPGESVTEIYGEMMRRHWACGLVDARDAFDGLSLIVMPGFTLMDDMLAAKLTAFVEAGGTLVATARTATRNRDNNVIDTTPPGRLADLFGVTVEEFGKLSTPDVALTADNGFSATAGGAYEILAPITAGVLARWQAAVPHIQAAHDRPAISVNHVGDGRAVYVGTYIDGQNAPMILDLVSSPAIEPLAEAGPVVEITCRHSEERRLLFCLNHSTETQPVVLPVRGSDLISGQEGVAELVLPPYEVAVVRLEQAP